MEYNNNLEEKEIKKKISFNKIKKKMYYNIIERKSIASIMKGGKILRKRLVIVIGDFKNILGIGVNKDPKFINAKKKAIDSARKNFLKVPVTYTYSIPQNILSAFAAAAIYVQPANFGTGITGTSHIQNIANLCGIKNLISKQSGSASILNNSFAIYKAFKILNRLIWLAKIRSSRMYNYYTNLLKKN